MLLWLALFLAAGPPRTAAGLAASGWQAFEQGRFQQAEQDLEQACKLAPANASFALALGQVYLGTGKPRLAIPQLEKAARGLGHPPDVRFTLAQAYQAVDEDAKALAALSGDPPAGALSGTWRFTRAFSLFRLGRYRDAEPVFRALLDSPQLEVPAHFFAANCLYARGQFEQALPFYEKAVAAGDRPDNKAFNVYLYNQGLALYQLNRFDLATVAFQRSIQRFSKDPLPWLFLGRCEAELGRHAAAIAALEESIRLQPGLRLAYYHLARLHSQHGDAQRAGELFQKVAGLRQQELEREEQLARRLQVSSK